MRTEKQKKIIYLCVGGAFVLAIVGIILFAMRGGSTEDSTDPLLSVVPTISEEPEYYSAGIYFYDAEGNKIRTDAVVDIETENTWELDCMNLSNCDVNYYPMIWVNNCFQECTFTDVQGDTILESGAEVLGPNETKRVRVNFSAEVDEIREAGNNRLELVVLFYSTELPKKDTHEWSMTVTEEHVARLGAVSENYVENYLEDYREYSTGNNVEIHSIAMTGTMPEDVAKLGKSDDYIEENDGNAYFCTAIKPGEYIAILFVDGTPTKVQGEYTFQWMQKEQHWSILTLPVEPTGHSIVIWMKQCGGDENEITSGPYYFPSESER